MVSNLKTREQLPRPSMASLLTQEPKDLDHANRFFEDARQKMENTLEYDPYYKTAQPTYSHKKDIAYKVTSAPFTKMPLPEDTAP